MAAIKLTLHDGRSPRSRMRLGREQITVLRQVCPCRALPPSLLRPMVVRKQRSRYEDAGRDNWLVMSMPVEVLVPEANPGPAPTVGWFAHTASMRTDTEREVEMYFASPLFHEGLGYNEKQEAAGFGIRWARASTPGHVEADPLCFAGDKHDVKADEPLVLVECKRLINDENELQAAAAQAHSYALWIISANYVITDGRIVSVWDFQGAVAPDRELLRASPG